MAGNLLIYESKASKAVPKTQFTTLFPFFELTGTFQGSG